MVLGREQNFIQESTGECTSGLLLDSKKCLSGCWCLAFLSCMHPDLAKSSGAISILTSESFLLGGVGRKGQWPESSLSSCPNSQRGLGSPVKTWSSHSGMTFQGLTFVHRLLSMVGTISVGTFWALRYTINTLTSALHQLHPSGMGVTPLK